MLLEFVPSLSYLKCFSFVSKLNHLFITATNEIKLLSTFSTWAESTCRKVFSKGYVFSYSENHWRVKDTKKKKVFCFNLKTLCKRGLNLQCFWKVLGLNAGSNSQLECGRQRYATPTANQLRTNLRRMLSAMSQTNEKPVDMFLVIWNVFVNRITVRTLSAPLKTPNVPAS